VWRFSCACPAAAGVFVLALMLATQLCARPQAQATGIEGGQTNPLADGDVVQGTVVNRVTHEPVARVLVFTPDDRFAVLTDDRGRFEFKFPPRDGTAPPNQAPSDDPEQVRAQQRALQIWFARILHFETFFARKPGYLALEHETRSTTNSRPAGPMIIELEPEARITGLVQLPDADGVERGQIQIYRQEFQEGQPSWRMVDTVKIRLNGEFRFAELPAGTYKLFTLEQMERIPPIFNARSQLFGYPPVYFPNSKDFASAMPIHLAAGATFEGNISLVRREYYPVRIEVSGASSQGGVSLALYPQGRPGPGYELGFDPGEGAIRGFLPDGSYTLKLSLQQDQGWSGVLNFTVRGGPVEGLAVALIPNISLRVSVKTDFQPQSSNDEQVRGVRGSRTISKGQVGISLMPVDSFENGRAAFANPANQENEETIADISPGAYWVQIRAPACYVVSATWGGADLLRHPLVVGTDGAGTPIEVVLRDDGAEVSGTVREPGNDNLPGAKAVAPPPGNATVYFVPTGDSEGQFRSIRTTENGQFALSQIPPGTYRLLAFLTEQKNLDLLNPVEMRKYESKGIVLQLAPDQRETLQAPLTLVDEP